jgi:hypothetical protein
LGDEEQVGGYDLIYKNGYVTFDENCVYTSYLGCANHRDGQLTSLAKQNKKKKAAVLKAAARKAKADKEDALARKEERDRRSKPNVFR